ncbi:MAG TPA: fibronectin type III domain-containing protein [Terracidiphilus sp.]|nr:fibronectin type III domain-containing protein [Terracidiphilus sp.]
MVTRERWVGSSLVCALAAMLAGCGTQGAPLPPSLNLPDRVTDLAAVRNGNQVSLSWTMPKRNTDKLLLKGNVKVVVCRKEDASVCDPVGTVSFAPGVAGSYSENLSATLASGDPRVLRYFVELKNRKGRSAGLSNAALVPGGEAPAPVAGFTAEVQKAGVVLHWTPDNEKAAVRLQRTLENPPAVKPKKQVLGEAPESAEQNLIVEDGSQSGGAIDRSIHFGDTYIYKAQRVAQIEAEGQTLELDGAFSQPVRVEALDVFPPAVPKGLAAVATAGEDGSPPAIDLSWQPNTEPDLAGYIVYRREGDGPWERISPAQPVAGPSFHDDHVKPGETYTYAVSAIDQGGHESARSAATLERVPSS